ncbi:restriction system-associated AAA family ATPase [Pelagicoccus sp. SDUM812002]|uniref:restriction system-associated AAA family ATPase n=1 Tax=Pelagicoccus sp. SDUM812002 TaxID=3041266 RepID=UPI00280CB4CB|nr:restriction system-associated AAA family ATPase [Pelagicoccus sp. SDUM812002]MDQ8187677.1 restriction system-associated AAA family ATPase [Pelagicoccus sp. SDUM812002]
MKLIRLKLNSPFRSLAPGFEINFLNEWNEQEAYQFNPYCLVGKNGSGKSNVLEALAAIFYHIECIYLSYRPDNLSDEENNEGFDASRSTPDAFELEYHFRLASEDWNDIVLDYLPTLDLSEPNFVHISITKQSGTPPVIRSANIPLLNEKDGTLNRARVKRHLPKYILGYTSGHNEILSLPFQKMRFIHFDEYYERLSKGLDYIGVPEGRLIYLDEQYSQAILLCHFLFPNEHILKTFADEIGVEAIKSFSIGIRHPSEPTTQSNQFPAQLPMTFEEPRRELVLTSKLTKVIDRFGKCSTTQFEDEHTSEQSFDFWNNDATREAFKLHFGSALELFQAFQILFTLNLHTVTEEIKKELYLSESLYASEKIPSYPSDSQVMRFKNFFIKKRSVDEPILLKALSDGEHQFMHTIGVCLLYRNEPALFLLDEPETHLNPGWRASYISILRRALEEDSDAKKTSREILLTSHSPFIVSDCRQENVLVFKKSVTNKVICSRPDFNTFGASANTITAKIFDQGDTIGNYARSKIEEFDRRLAMGENGEDLMDEADEMLGDSIEKVLLTNRAIKS